jgi:hypothetical protein
LNEVLTEIRSLTLFQDAGEASSIPKSGTLARRKTKA